MIKLIIVFATMFGIYTAGLFFVPTLNRFAFGLAGIGFTYLLLLSIGGGIVAWRAIK